MNDEKEHGNVGNRNAAKPKKEKLTESRTFRFKAEELRAYVRLSKAEPKVNGETMPLRVWVRKTLNEKAGLPPPEWHEE